MNKQRRGSILDADLSESFESFLARQDSSSDFSDSGKETKKKNTKSSAPEEKSTFKKDVFGKPAKPDLQHSLDLSESSESIPSATPSSTNCVHCNSSLTP